MASVEDKTDINADGSGRPDYSNKISDIASAVGQASNPPDADLRFERGGAASDTKLFEDGSSNVVPANTARTLFKITGRGISTFQHVSTDNKDIEIIALADGNVFYNYSAQDLRLLGRMGDTQSDIVTTRYNDRGETYSVTSRIAPQVRSEFELRAVNNTSEDTLVKTAEIRFADTGDL